MNRIFLYFSILIASLVMPTFISTAQATTVLELTDGQLVDLSSEIVYGKIIKIDTMMHANGMILTKVTMHVNRWLKSQSHNTPDTFVFYTRGGSYGDISQTVSGELTPNLNDEMVVFLERIPRYDNLPMLLGLKQGAFIAENRGTDRLSKTLRHNTDGLTLYKNASFVSDFRTAKTIEDLISHIEQHLKGNTP